MARSEMVYYVFIASPRDVNEDRFAVRDTIYEWNSMNSKNYNLHFTPKMWEIDSTPEMGARGQAIINKRLLNESDIMIAMFGTRLGSPTGDYASGTVEEISHFIQDKKPVGVYFSNRPTSISDIDLQQISALNEYKQTLYSQGLLDSYESTTDLKQKILRFLTVQANDLKEINEIDNLRLKNQKLESFENIEREQFLSALEMASRANSDGHWLSVVCDYGEGFEFFQSKVKHSIVNWATQLGNRLQFGVNLSNAIMGQDFVRICVPNGNAPTDFGLFYQNTGIVTLQWRKNEKSISLPWVIVRCILALRSLLNEGIVPNHIPIQIGFTLSHAPENGIKTKGVFECISTHSNYQFQRSIWKSIYGEPIDIDKFIKNFIDKTLGDWGYLDYEDKLENLQLNQSLMIYTMLEDKLAYES